MLDPTLCFRSMNYSLWSSERWWLLPVQNCWWASIWPVIALTLKLTYWNKKIMSKKSILTTKAINRLLPVQNCLVRRKSTSHRSFKSRLTRGAESPWDHTGSYMDQATKQDRNHFWLNLDQCEHKIILRCLGQWPGLCTNPNQVSKSKLKKVNDWQ